MNSFFAKAPFVAAILLSASVALAGTNNYGRLGCDPIPSSDESESAIAATLAPDGYTGIVQVAGTVQGVALVQVYILGQ
jgi:hypothetical protein